MKKHECDICSVKKIRIARATIESPKHPRYVDIFRRYWDGNTCPDCALLDLELESHVTHRQCKIKARGCLGILTKDRYSVCTSCRPSLNYDVDEGMVF